MPPTDCFEGPDATASIACVPDRHHDVMGPASRSPMHHGTDPDLSAPTPLPAGGSVPGLDLSPVTAAGEFLSGTGRVGVNQLQAVAMAKRKLRGSPGAAGPSAGGSASVGSTTTRPGRAFGKEHSHSHQPKRAAMQIGQGTAPCRMSRTSTRERQQQSPGVSAMDVKSELETGDGATSTDACADMGDGPPGFDKLVAGRTSLKPRLLSSAVCQSPGAATADTEPATPDSDGGLTRDSVETPTESESAPTARPDSGESGKDIQEVMAKANKAAAYIRLLLHAKRCPGRSCREPGCETARQLVAHMHGCSKVGSGSCKPTCVQAHRLLEHYADCSRKRALGRRYCLVCSLVARSANHGNNNASSSPSNRCSSTNNSTCGFNRMHLQRKPLGYLGTGALSSRGYFGVGGRENVACGAGGMRSPGAISRLKRVGFGQGTAVTGGGGGASSGAEMRMDVGTAGSQKDGEFFRPLPCKARSGSWGGYDRRRLMRRARFDSIPEGLAEEEDDDLDQETTSEGGSESIDESCGGSGSAAGGRSSSDTRSAHSKSFISSHSL